MGWLLLLIPLCIAIFIIFHVRPPTESQISQLAQKRRKKAIKEYFNVHDYPVNMDLEFKKKMKPSGEFYGINEIVGKFPSVAASLLKYKKHEWLILGFERDRQVVLFWTNKGPDNRSVGYRVDLLVILKCIRQD